MTWLDDLTRTCLDNNAYKSIVNVNSPRYHCVSQTRNHVQICHVGPRFSLRAPSSSPHYWVKVTRKPADRYPFISPHDLGLWSRHPIAPCQTMQLWNTTVTITTLHCNLQAKWIQFAIVSELVTMSYQMNIHLHSLLNWYV